MARAILSYLHNTPTLPTINTIISPDDLNSLYQVWKESTTTSPSGLQLGRDKGPLQYSDNTDIGNIQRRIIKIKSQFINLALKNNIIYERWKSINTVMIEKQPNLYHIEKLRALHLFESDLNGILGILWGRRLMIQAEYHNILHDSQHGSRNGRSTDTLLLTKHLTYSIWRLTHTNGMTFDNDAKSYHDRIVMNVALLASQHLGMPQSICDWYQQVFNNAQYHIHTSYVSFRTILHSYDSISFAWPRTGQPSGS